MNSNIWSPTEELQGLLCLAWAIHMAHTQHFSETEVSKLWNHLVQHGGREQGLGEWCEPQ